MKEQNTIYGNKRDGFVLERCFTRKEPKHLNENSGFVARLPTANRVGSVRWSKIPALSPAEQLIIGRPPGKGKLRDRL